MKLHASPNRYPLNIGCAKNNKIKTIKVAFFECQFPHFSPEFLDGAGNAHSPSFLMNAAKITNE